MNENIQSKNKAARFFIALWNESLAKFIANAVTLLLMICLVKFLIFAFEFFLIHSQSHLVSKINKFSFNSFKISDLVNLILSTWVIISLAVIAIDYFIIYPIQCGKRNKRATNGP